MTDLRKAARGRECQIRLPGVCNFDPETSVLAHYRLSGLNGVGTKPPDVCAAIACSACHSAVDGQRSWLKKSEIRLAHAEGCLRTIAIWQSEGLL
jgi:hypothetical protein